MSLLDSPNPAEPNVPDHQDSSLKKLLPITSIGCILALLYVAYVFYSRHQSDVEALARLEAGQQAARQKTVDTVFGHGEIIFNQFSVDTMLLKRGQTAHLCYGVENATTVKLDPPVEAIKPTVHHCVDISPKQTTTYTITADDGKGHTKSESLELKVE